MKVTKEQVEQIIKEEIKAALAESDWDPSRMTKKAKDNLRRAQGAPPAPESYTNDLEPLKVVEMKMAIGLLDRNPEMNISLPEDMRNWVVSQREDLADRIHVK